MVLSNNHEAFLTLLRAGIWECEAQLLQYNSIDFNEVYRLDEEQSVIGLISAGLEHISDIKLPQELVLPFVGATLQLGQRNKDMNVFIGNLIEGMRKSGIYTLLVKGQGVAQCYERPLWSC